MSEYVCVDKMHIVRSEGSNSKTTLREDGGVGDGCGIAKTLLRKII